MTNAFFLLIMPTPTLTIHVGSYQQRVGMSLRGSCTSADDAAHLGLAVQHLLQHQPTHAWVDSQQLHALSQLGRLALLRANASGQQVGTQLHWCGLPAPLLRGMQANGLAQKFSLQPASDFEGPVFLLPKRPVLGLSAA